MCTPAKRSRSSDELDMGDAVKRSRPRGQNKENDAPRDSVHKTIDSGCSVRTSSTHLTTLADVERAIVNKLGLRGGLRDAFLRLDGDRNGSMTAEELRVGLQRLDLEVSPDMALQLIQKYDTKGQGFFDFDAFTNFWEGAFTQFMTSSQVASNPAYGEMRRIRLELDEAPEDVHERQQHILNAVRDKLRSHSNSDARSRHMSQAFLKMDTDRNGYLSYDEFSLGLHLVGLDLSIQDLMALVEPWDPNHTGQLRVNDFYGLFQDKAEQPESPMLWSPRKGNYHRQKPEGRRPLADLPIVPPSQHRTEYTCVIKDALPDDMVLKKIAMAFEEERLKLRQAFEKMDLNGNGTLEEEEFSKGLDMVGISISSDHAKRLFHKYNYDGSGLHYKDFVRMISATCSHMQEDMPEPALASMESEQQTINDHQILASVAAAVYSKYTNTRKAFLSFDKDGTKVISKEEFAKGIEALDLALSQREQEMIMEKFTDDGKNGIQYHNFMKIMAALQG